MISKLVWVIQQVQGQCELHRETLSKKKMKPKYREREWRGAGKREQMRARESYRAIETGREKEEIVLMWNKKNPMKVQLNWENIQNPTKFSIERKTVERLP